MSSERSESPDDPTNLPQITNLAVNCHGWALCLPKKYQFHDDQIITARATCSKKVEARQQQLVEEKIKFSSMHRESLTFTKEEKEAPTRRKYRQYMIIGFSPRETGDEAKWSKRNPGVGTNQGKPLGNTYPKSGLYDWNDKDLPYYVVTPVAKQGKQVRSYALLAPMTGLCHTAVIEQNNVFYLPRFRDRTTATRERKLAWNRLIFAALQAYLPESPSAAATTAQEHDEDDETKEQEIEGQVEDVGEEDQMEVNGKAEELEEIEQEGTDEEDKVAEELQIDVDDANPQEKPAHLEESTWERLQKVRDAWIAATQQGSASSEADHFTEPMKMLNETITQLKQEHIRKPFP